MKIFGRELFNFRKKVDTHLWDFAQFGILHSGSTVWNGGVTSVTLDHAVSSSFSLDTLSKPVVKKKEITPKELFKLSSLNEQNFLIKSSDDYIDNQISLAKEKLKLYRDKAKVNLQDYGPVKYGKEEIRSIIERLENRKHLSKYKDILEKYPHTTSKLIGEVLEQNNHLRCESAEDFIPDLPREAVKLMKEYNKMCQELCRKDTHFYVIANQEDFVEKNKKRDPILLAQSPFGFFWQILGAWDEEMIYLGDL